MDVQQSNVISMFDEVDYTDRSIIESEIERVKDDIELQSHSFLRFICPSKVEGGVRSLDLDYKFIMISSRNMKEVINLVKDGHTKLLPILSYAYIQSKLHHNYNGVYLESIFQPAILDKPVTEEQALKSISVQLETMSKERLKVKGIEIGLTSERAKIKVNFNGTEYVRTYPVYISIKSISNTYIESVFTHLCYLIKCDVENDTINIDNDEIKKFVISLMDVFGNAYL